MPFSSRWGKKGGEKKKKMCTDVDCPKKGRMGGRGRKAEFKLLSLSMN